MQFPFLKQTAIATGAAAVVLVVATIAFFSIQNGPVSPAAKVPARETVAFFTNITKETATTFAAYVPMLSQVALDDTPSAVAIIKTGSGQTGWAILQRTPADEEPFSLRVSDPSLSDLFHDREEPLSTSYAYRALHRKKNDDPSVWLRFPDVSINPASPFASLLKTAEPALIVSKADGLEVSVITDDSFPVLMSGPKEVFERPLFIAHVSNGTAFLENIQSHLQENPLMVSKTVLGSALASLFGQGISMTYDLPPVLEGATTVEVAKGNGNALRVFVEGTIPDDKEVFQNLVDRFKGNLTAIAVHRETFDEKFDWQDIREDKSVIEDISDARNGWTLRTIRQTQSGKALFIATRGRRFILSNDGDAFQKGITTEAAPLGATEAPPSGLGLIHSADVGTLLRQSIPTAWPASMQIPAGESGYLKWKLMQEGRRITLLFKEI